MYTEEIVPIKIGMISCVGVGHERPCSWGNYFYLADPYPCR